MLLDSAFGFRHKQKKLKDHEEYILKTNIISESNKLKNQLASTQDKMNIKNEELATKYKKSEIKEKELNDYIQRNQHQVLLQLHTLQPHQGAGAKQDKEQEDKQLV